MSVDESLRGRRRRLAAAPDPRERARLLLELQRIGDLPPFQADPDGREWFEVNANQKRWPWDPSYAIPDRRDPLSLEIMGPEYFNHVVLARWEGLPGSFQCVRIRAIYRSGWPFVGADSTYGGSFSSTRRARLPLTTTETIYTLTDLGYDGIDQTVESNRLRRLASRTSILGVEHGGLEGLRYNDGMWLLRWKDGDAFQRSLLLWTKQAVGGEGHWRDGWSKDVIDEPERVVWGARRFEGEARPGRPGAAEIGWRRLDYFLAALAIYNYGYEDETVRPGRQFDALGFPWPLEPLEDPAFLSSLGFSESYVVAILEGGSREVHQEPPQPYDDPREGERATW